MYEHPRVINKSLQWVITKYKNSMSHNESLQNAKANVS